MGTSSARQSPQCEDDSSPGLSFSAFKIFAIVKFPGVADFFSKANGTRLSERGCVNCAMETSFVGRGFSDDITGCIGLSGKSGELKLASDFIRFGDLVIISSEELVASSGVAAAGLLSWGGALESKAGRPAAAFRRSALGRSLVIIKVVSLAICLFSSIFQPKRKKRTMRTVESHTLKGIHFFTSKEFKTNTHFVPGLRPRR